MNRYLHTINPRTYFLQTTSHLTKELSTKHTTRIMLTLKLLKTADCSLVVYKGGERRNEGGGRREEGGGRREGGGQRREDGGQRREEGGGRREEGGGWRVEGGRRTEDGGRRTEDGGRRNNFNKWFIKFSIRRYFPLVLIPSSIR